MWIVMRKSIEVVVMNDTAISRSVLISFGVRSVFGGWFCSRSVWDESTLIRSGAGLFVRLFVGVFLYWLH